MNELKKWMDAGMPASMSYSAYIILTEELLAQGRTTGENQSDLYINFTQLNLQRMRRIAKTFTPNDALAQFTRQLTPQTWVVITEPWCGDAAQTVPLIAALAQLNQGIELRLILRDEHPAIMNLYLTNGGKAIPIWVALNEAHEAMFTWGPRPAEAQQMVRDYKAMEAPKPDYLEFAQSVQKWYTADQGRSFSSEVSKLFSTVVQS